MGIGTETIRKRAADTTKMNTGEKEENRAYRASLELMATRA